MILRIWHGRAWRPRRAVTGLAAWDDQDVRNGEALGISPIKLPSIRTAIRRTNGRTEAGSALIPVPKLLINRRKGDLKSPIRRRL